MAELTNEEINTLVQFSVLATVTDEWFTYAEPLLARVEEAKYSNRKDKRAVKKMFLNDIKKHKKWLRGTANTIDRDFPAQVQTAIDKIHEFLKGIEVEEN